jgi:hypothetical protein
MAVPTLITTVPAVLDHHIHISLTILFGCRKPSSFLAPFLASHKCQIVIVKAQHKYLSPTVLKKRLDGI